MKDLLGKRLLILGGKAILVDLVRRAKALGVYTIVVDRNPLEMSPAKVEADKYYNIDFSEFDKIVELIKNEKIDGVLTGFTDSYLKYYIEICEAAEVPCYGNFEQFEIATNKAAFKAACIKAGVPVIPGGSAGNFENAKELADKIGYPVIVKPSDNSGSRGVIKCNCEADILDCYNFASSFSANGIVIVEKFMDCDNIATSYFVADGEIRLTTTCERKLHISNETGSSITSFTKYPSKYTNRYIKEVGESVERFLKTNHFRNGMIAFQAFVDDESFYFCEMCFRPSGGHHYILIEDQNKIDEMGLLIEFAVTGECVSSWDKASENPYFKQTCAMVKLIGTSGKIIARYDGIDKINSRDDVIQVISMLNVGDTIGKDGTTAQILATIWYRCPDGADPVALAYEIADDIVIEDEAGNNLSRISIM